MADGTPFLKPADDFTGHCSAAVTGQKFVVVSGNQQADGPYTIANASVVGADVLAVAMRDGAVGDRILLMTEGVLPVVAGATLTAGQTVMTDATGAAIPWVTAASEANKRAGKVMADTASGAVAPIKVNL